MPILFCIFTLSFSMCNQREKPFYKSEAFTVFPDRVEQGGFRSTAISPEHMISDYVSLAKTSIDPLIQFKFSINGRDDELAFGVNHEANIFPESDGEVVLDVKFGERSNLRTDMKSSQPLPVNTKVRFRVDFTRVLKDFEGKGYYDDILGKRIYREDFKGLFIAGDTYPLGWDFENLAGNEKLKMQDPDGDGIFENEMVFNVYDPSAHTSSEWRLNNDLSEYPQFSSASVLMNALYNMSLDELIMLKEDDGTFRTGKEWAGVWTRDVSYATVLALAYIEPDRCEASLMRKVADKRIIQDTGTGGAWPVSSDRVVWGLAAWEIYKYTGDKQWLENAFEILKNSVEDDRNTILDPATGLIRGESSFLDWRKQTYPLWMEPADIFSSLNLGTNAAYYQALRTLGMMATALGREDSWSAQAEQLRKGINALFWQPEKGYYGQYLYGQFNRSLSPRSEALGEAFTVLFDIADEAQKISVLQNTPVNNFGIPCIFPQIPGIPPYHNNGIWPFVQAFWTIANAGQCQVSAVEFGLASIVRPAALFLTNKENFVAETGDFAGTEINSDRQLWSVAAMLAMYSRVIFGMHFEPDKITLNPVIPESFKGTYTLKNFKYREGTWQITVTGFGDRIGSFKVDGKEATDQVIPSATTGNHNIEIVMNSKVSDSQIKIVPKCTAPETPILSYDTRRLTWSAVSGVKEYLIFRNGARLDSTVETFMSTEDHGGAAEYQVLAADSSGIESFLSNPVSIVPEAFKLILEAEEFNLPGEKKVEGFTGKGYVTFSSKDKKALIIRANTEEDRYALRMRYANGAGPVNTDNNCGIRSLYVNGIFSGSLIFPQRGKDEWANWGMTNVEWIKLKKGDNILTIRYEDFNRNMDGEINEFLLDYVLLQKIN